MKQRGTQSWTNYTVAQVMREIAALFGLEADVEDDGTVWPVLHMAGRSYWTFCAMMANRIGFTFYVSGVRLVCKRRQTDPLQAKGLVAFYDYRGDPGSLPLFTPVLGATNPTGGELAVRQIAGVDPRTMQPVWAEQSGSPQSTYLGTAVNAPVFTRTSHHTVSDLAQAQARVEGLGAANQLYITSSASGAGNPAIGQGSLIYVANANGSQNGLWYVVRAEHEITPNNYTMQLSLGRDSLGSSGSVGGSLSTTNFPTAQLRNGIWVAA
jgi:phage protein D